MTDTTIIDRITRIHTLAKYRPAAMTRRRLREAFVNLVLNAAVAVRDWHSRGKVADDLYYDTMAIARSSLGDLGIDLDAELYDEQGQKEMYEDRPRFQAGDRVRWDCDVSWAGSGVVVRVGGFDPYLDDRRYVVRFEVLGESREQWCNGKSLEPVST